MNNDSEIYIITGTVPSKKNSKAARCIRRIINGIGKWVPLIRSSDKWRERYNEMLAELVAQRNGDPIILCDNVHTRIHRKDQRRWDGDNTQTSCWDLLVDARIIEDDSWKHIPRWSGERVEDDKDFVEIIIS